MPRLSLRFIGPLRAELDGAPVTGFNSDKTRALLAYLVIESDRPHRREALAALLWPDVPESSARQSLSQSLSNLRKLLKDAENQPPYIQATAESVQFNRAADYALDLDALRGRAAGALPHGGLLDGLSIRSADAFEEWLLVQREAVQRELLDALEASIRAALSNGDAAAAAAGARRQLELDPWRESAHRHLMRALVQSGDRAAALAQYERCAQALRSELGIDPGPETQALAEQIRRGELVNGDGAASAPRVAAASAALPNPITPFIGRARELDEVGALLANPAARLITIAGLGGMGKTRLAIESARRAEAQFAGRVTFVPLASETRAAQIVPAIASALELSLSNQGDPLAQLLSALRGDARLLVLDNLEPLIAADPQGTCGVITALLAGTARLSILLTSRLPLQVPGEWLYRLDGFQGIEESAALFMQSARRAHPGLHISSADRPAIDRICRLVDGMPLGIELAAAWSSVLSPAEIAQELASGGEVLNEPQVARAERHRSIATVLDQSWNRLGDAERGILAALSTFRGSFTREMARQVAGASLASLSQLVAQSLLRRTESGRYALHELVRQYAAARLSASSGAAATQRRHAEAMLAWVESTERRLYGPQAGAARREIEAELANIRAAWEWARSESGDPAVALALAAAMARFWYQLPDWREGKRWLEAALARAGESHAGDGHGAWARAQLGLGMLEHALSNEPSALACFERAFPAFRAQGDRWHAAWTLCQAAQCHFSAGRLQAAEESSRQSLAEFREVGDAWAQAFVTWQLADLAWVRDEVDAARALALAALGGFRALEDGETSVLALLLLGDIALRDGDTDAAIERYSDGLALSRAAHNGASTAWCLQTLGQARLLQGAPEAAATHLAEALALREAMGDRRAISEALHALGICAVGMGDFDRAAAWFSAAEAQSDIEPFAYNEPMLGLWRSALAEARAALGEARWPKTWTDEEPPKARPSSQ